ncbi:MAG: hypothetical protein M9958_11850 [Chitinophagales bacterium]|nr:hypothetical protein [Chitinophagales bacterium]
MDSSVQQNPPSTIFVILFSAFLAAFAFVVSSVLPILLKLPHKNDMFEIFVGIVSILFAVGFTTFVLRKMNRDLSFAKIFLSGWATVLVMSVLISIFYSLAFGMNWLPIPEGASIGQIVSVVILKYNALGMIFSSIFALIFKRQ